MLIARGCREEFVNLGRPLCVKAHCPSTPDTSDTTPQHILELIVAAILLPIRCHARYWQNTGHITKECQAQLAVVLQAGAWPWFRQRWRGAAYIELQELSVLDAAPLALELLHLQCHARRVRARQSEGGTLWCHERKVTVRHQQRCDSRQLGGWGGLVRGASSSSVAAAKGLWLGPWAGGMVNFDGQISGNTTS
jgi:hypothetical protein